MDRLKDILYARMRDEYRNLIDRFRGMEADEIIKHSYEKVFKEDILMCVDEGGLAEDEVKVLLKTKYPLDECYTAWVKSDWSYMLDLTDCISENAGNLAKVQKKRDKTERLL